MSEIFKILLTSSITVLTGVTIFIGGQIVIKFIIEPIQALRKTLKDIQYAILFYQASYSTPGGKEELEEEACKAFKTLSGELCSNAKSIPFYQCWSSISNQFLPSMANIIKATIELRSLSNSVQAKDRSYNFNKANKICDLLNLQRVV